MTKQLPIPDKPLNVLVTKTLTLSEVSAEDKAMIAQAAGSGAVITIVDSPKEGVKYASDADVILGITPKWLFEAAPNLKWVHATASGVDMFMYEEFIQSDVTLTGERASRRPFGRRRVWFTPRSYEKNQDCDRAGSRRVDA